MIRRAALDGGGDDLAGERVGLVLVLLLDLLDLHGALVADVVLHALEDIGFRLLLRQAGDLFQHLHLPALERSNVLFLFLNGSHLAGQLVLLLLVLIELFVE